MGDTSETAFSYFPEFRQKIGILPIHLGLFQKQFGLFKKRRGVFKKRRSVLGKTSKRFG
jgi:hypothetical protein